MTWLLNRTKLVRRLALVFLALVSVGLIGSWIVVGKLMAPQASHVGDPPGDLPAIPISLDSDSGSTIAGWHIPANAQAGVIVLLHPRHGTRLSMLGRARMLHAAGYSIVMIDLQAHGESPGAQVTLGYLESRDVRAAIEFARQRHPGEPLAVLGISLGGASALLGSPLGIDCLVLESVYPDIRTAVHNRVALRLGPLSFLAAELLLLQAQLRMSISPRELRPIDKLALVNCPVLLISGVDDRHTTASETRAMFAVALQPKELWLVDGAAHTDLLEAAPKEYRKRVLDFLQEHMQALRDE